MTSVLLRPSSNRNQEREGERESVRGPRVAQWRIDGPKVDSDRYSYISHGWYNAFGLSHSVGSYSTCVAQEALCFLHLHHQSVEGSLFVR